MIDVKFKKIDESVQDPIKGSPGAACWDIFAHSVSMSERNISDSSPVLNDVILNSSPYNGSGISLELVKRPNLLMVHEATISTGLKFEIPEGYKLVVVPRSSINHGDWFMRNSPAQIDSDYRGELILKFTKIVFGSLGLVPPYLSGERFAQMFLERVIDVNFYETFGELSETARGEGGFGSTGK